MTRQDRYPTCYHVLRHSFMRERERDSSLLLIQNCPRFHSFPSILPSMGSTKHDMLQLWRGKLLKCFHGFAGVRAQRGRPQPGLPTGPGRAWQPGPVPHRPPGTGPGRGPTGGPGWAGPRGWEWLWGAGDQRCRGAAVAETDGHSTWNRVPGCGQGWVTLRGGH